MTLDKLVDLTCSFFAVSRSDFEGKERGAGKDKGGEDISIARHCFRCAAYEKYATSKTGIGKFEKRNNATILHSIKLVTKDGVFKKQYEDFLTFLDRQKQSNVEIVVDKNGIERITNDAFDERLYKHPTRVNERTGLPYFPAFHFITGEGEPTPYGLLEWYKQMGYKANEILERSQEIGSYVHNSIDRMITTDHVVTHDEIHTAFPNSKEAQKVKECLLGFVNFMRDEEPIILASETMVCGEDFGLTADNKLRIKSDKYKHVWASDWKTSKTASESHKMQVEVIRRTLRCDRGMVVVLGNNTKTKYTITKIPLNRYDYYWDKFLAIKETAYVEILDKGWIKPREDNMPSEFSLKDINIKRKL